MPEYSAVLRPVPSDGLQSYGGDSAGLPPLKVLNFALSVFIYYIGEDTLRTILAQGSYLQPMLAALAGFIPNCAASVILAQLFMDGVLSFGALTAGLITSAGLGLLVLLRMYDNKKDILRIFAILFVTAITSGIVLQLF